MLNTESRIFYSPVKISFPKRKEILALSVIISLVLVMMLFLLPKKKHETHETSAASTQATIAVAKPSSNIEPKTTTAKPASQQANTDASIQDAMTLDANQVNKLRALVLPPSKSKPLPALLPPPNLVPAASVITNNTPPALQRCFYNGQNYVAGDMVKTEQGWIRCTPTFVFSPENPTAKQSGNAAWTAVQ